MSNLGWFIFGSIQSHYRGFSPSHLPASFLGPVPPSLTVLCHVAPAWSAIKSISGSFLDSCPLKIHLWLLPLAALPFPVYDQAYFSSKNYPFEKLFSLKYLSLSSLSRHHCFLLTCAEHLPSAKSCGHTTYKEPLCLGRFIVWLQESIAVLLLEWNTYGSRREIMGVWGLSPMVLLMTVESSQKRQEH